MASLQKNLKNNYMHKRIEVNNLKEIQEELINYNFFKHSYKTGKWGTYDGGTGIEGLHMKFCPTETSAAYFEEIPDLIKLKEFLDTVVHTDKISHFFVMNFGGGFCSDIHFDLDSNWALNIPIINCENSSTVFYDKEQRELDRITLDVPHFLNIGVYHQMINHNKVDNRLALSVRFDRYALDEIIK